MFPLSTPVRPSVGSSLVSLCRSARVVLLASYVASSRCDLPSADPRRPRRGSRAVRLEKGGWGALGGGICRPIHCIILIHPFVQFFCRIRSSRIWSSSYAVVISRIDATVAHDVWRLCRATGSTRLTIRTHSGEAATSPRVSGAALRRSATRKRCIVLRRRTSRSTSNFRRRWKRGSSSK